MDKDKDAKLCRNMHCNVRFPCFSGPPKPELTYRIDNTSTSQIFLDVLVPGDGSTCEVDTVTVEATDPASTETVSATCGDPATAEISQLSPGTSYTFTATANKSSIESEESGPLTGPTGIVFNLLDTKQEN